MAALTTAGCCMHVRKSFGLAAGHELRRLFAMDGPGLQYAMQVGCHQPSAAAAHTTSQGTHLALCLLLQLSFKPGATIQAAEINRQLGQPWSGVVVGFLQVRAAMASRVSPPAKSCSVLLRPCRPWCMLPEATSCPPAQSFGKSMPKYVPAHCSTRPPVPAHTAGAAACAGAACTHLRAGLGAACGDWDSLNPAPAVCQGRALGCDDVPHACHSGPAASEAAQLPQLPGRCQASLQLCPCQSVLRTGCCAMC
jgi:hypothetical protein